MDDKKLTVIYDHVMKQRSEIDILYAYLRKRDLDLNILRANFPTEEAYHETGLDPGSKAAYILGTLELCILKEEQEIKKLTGV